MCLVAIGRKPVTDGLGLDKLGVKMNRGYIEVDGLTAGYWQDGALTYALVAETPDLQLSAIASELGAVEPKDVL